MKAILITVAAFFVVNAQARDIKPYDPKAQHYEVDGQTMTSAEATIAYLSGKSVKLCKAMAGVQAAKTYRINGKEVKGTELTTCTDQELVATRNGTTFKVKK